MHIKAAASLLLGFGVFMLRLGLKAASLKAPGVGFDFRVEPLFSCRVEVLEREPEQQQAGSMF